MAYEGDFSNEENVGLKAPARPMVERKPGDVAHAGNTVPAKDAFGAPRQQTEWSREAISVQRGTPGFDGVNDRIKSARAADFKA